MKRDILNYLNEKIGELELPDETSEDVWQKKLAVYALPPIVETPLESLENNTISKAEAGFAMYLRLVAMLDLGGDNGNVDQSLELYPLILNVRCLLKDGFFGMAYRYFVKQIVPLEILPQEIIDAFKVMCSDLIIKYGGTVEEIKQYEN
jgi:hypothetical protein